MPLTLGLTGMDPATETVLKTALEKANAALGNHFTLTGESDAKYVIVDMDSMYGPMSWLRLHGADKVVIGLTSAPRTQTDFRLARPFDADAVTALLRDVADKAGISLEQPVAPPAPTPVATPAPAAVPRPLPTAPPSGLTPAPAPQDELPEEHLRATDPESRPPPPSPVLAPTPTATVTSAAVAAPSMRPAEPAVATAPPVTPDPEPEPAPPPPPPRDRTLLDWLAPGVLFGRVRHVHASCPELLIDASARKYYGPPTLKPLQACFESPVERDAFAAVDDAGWKVAIAKLGEAQPLVRLQWYGALVAGQGGATLDKTGRYRLSKWPQTEREFPKHFRIATVMMKGPATIDEIAAASSLPHAEVGDFISANLATGYAEPVADEPPEPSEPPKPSGILGRLRGR
ncbi:MAG: hypothetical protein M3Q96_00640 [Pseudomonadota bacterium]|nr:hypothetical protein [Pseudomonadota bacterium]MDQ3229208.1 hypothetical protein [Pseudomonadota bacterium]